VRYLVPFLLATALVAGEAPVRVEFACSSDELRGAGLGCSEDDPCKVFLELSGIESSANRIFLTGNLHTESTTLASILLNSEDGGKTWTEAYQRMPFTTLDAIQFVDFEHGWISGENVQTVARNPFLLVTDDGGKTWRPQPLFEDEQPGAIQKFRFDSAKEGVLLLDRAVGNRYELYRTRTGGSNWELEQAASQPVTLPGDRARTAAPWRLRPDAATSAWMVEQNRGSSWQRVAALSTDVATCR